MVVSSETLLVGALRSAIERCPFQLNDGYEADAELLDVGGDELLAITIDTLHAGEELETAASPYAKGWLAATASLSDLAAVGARPLATLVSCSFPKEEMSEDEARDVGRGAAEATRGQDAYLVGGDTNWSTEESLTGCALGLVARERALTRIGARAGDALYVTGPVGGGNAAGARRLLGEDAGATTWLPAARCDAGAAIGGLARACIDTSDGLVSSAIMLADLNGLGVELDDRADVYDPLALELAARLGLPRWLLAVGEWGEFELVFAVAPEDEHACLEALAATTASPRRAGRLTNAAGHAIVDGTSRIDALEAADALRDLDRDGGLIEALSDLAGEGHVSGGLAVVTGIRGCVGSAVGHALAVGGHPVRGLVREPDGTAAYDEHAGDLEHPATLRGLCDGAEVVVHTAALVSDWDREGAFWRINAHGTRALLEEALRAGVRRFVYVSTADVFGFRRDVVIHEGSPKQVPDWPYSVTKMEGERLARRAEAAGLEVSVIYPTWIFGPGDRHFVPELLDGLETRQLVYFARGRTHLELTYSENLADAIVLVAESPEAAGESYIVGDGYGATFGDFIRLLAGARDLRPPRFSVPFRAAYWLGGAWELWARATRSRSRPLLTRYAVSSSATGMRYDTSSLRALGWEPRVGLEEAVRRTVGRAGERTGERDGWLVPAPS